MMLATLAAQPRHGLSEWLVSWRSGQACNGSFPGADAPSSRGKKPGLRRPSLRSGHGCSPAITPPERPPSRPHRAASRSKEKTS